MCEAIKPADDEVISVAKPYRLMKDSKILPSETSNDDGTYTSSLDRPRLGALH